MEWEIAFLFNYPVQRKWQWFKNIKHGRPNRKKIRIEEDQFLAITFLQDRIVNGSTLMTDHHEQTITIDRIKYFWPTSKEDAETRTHRTTKL